MYIKEKYFEIFYLSLIYLTDLNFVQSILIYFEILLIYLSIP